MSKHYTANQRIEQVKNKLIVAIDVGKLLFTGSVMIVFLGFYYFPDTIPGIVLQPPKKGAFSTKKILVFI